MSLFRGKKKVGEWWIAEPKSFVVDETTIKQAICYIKASALNNSISSIQIRHGLV